MHDLYLKHACLRNRTCMFTEALNMHVLLGKKKNECPEFSYNVNKLNIHNSLRWNSESDISVNI